MPAKKEQDTTFIGRTNFRGSERIFGIKTKDRRQHMYVIGKTGTGKTTLIKNMVLQDIRAGRGVGIIDPHGEFVEEVLGQIPPERTNDVVYFNPVDSEYPIGFNVLEVADTKYKHLVVSDLLGIFTKIWANVWSARMEYILQNCIMALLDTPGTTLLGIPRLLVDKDYRQKIVANVKDPVVKSFWVHEYETWRDQFRNEAIVPIQNKVNQFLNTSFIRNIVGQAKSTLNIPEIMNEGKILLVNVSKGKVGEDNSALLGAMIITKIQLASMERVRIAEEERRDYYLYVDEFQNFATDSFANILSEARKYRLNLIIAHQYVGQLVTDAANNSTKVRDAVFGNVGTMITFRVGATDAEFLETEFEPEFMIQDLINLPNHNIYLKVMVDGLTSRAFSASTLPPLKFETDPVLKDKIIEISRERYAHSRAEVEDKITRWSGMEGEGSGGYEDSNKLFESLCWNCGKTATTPFKPDGKRPVYCFSCLKQIEEGKLIPLPERMPKVGSARYSATLGDLGIEFAAPLRGESRSAGRVAPSGRASPVSPLRSPRSSFGGAEERSGSNFVGRSAGQKGRELAGAGIRGDERSRTHSTFSDRTVFSPRTVAPHQRREFERPGIKEERPFVPSGKFPSRPVVRGAPAVKPISLSVLKSRDESVPKEIMQKQKTQVDVSGLRKALDEALKTEESSIKNQEARDSGNQTKKIEPGETVKF